MSVSDAEKKKNVNAGHRQRMRERYLAVGLEGFQPHEVLEFLLFYAIPRRDTNKIAHALLEKFKTISGVMEADIEDLMGIDGISENSAVFLKMMPEVFRKYQKSKLTNRISVTKSEEFKAHLSALYVGKVKEQAYVLCLDANMGIICEEPVGEGGYNSVNLSVRAVAEVALRSRCAVIILAHNHPQGNTEPSSADMLFTRRIYNVLRSLDVMLYDHYIVGDKVVSLREAGYWDSIM